MKCKDMSYEMKETIIGQKQMRNVNISMPIKDDAQLEFQPALDTCLDNNISEKTLSEMLLLILR